MTKLLLIATMALPLVGCSESVSLKLNVKDEDGRPVTNAMVKITTLRKRTLNPHRSPNDYLTAFASSDTNGLVSAKIDMVSCSLTYWLSADGYYNSPFKHVHYRILSQDLFSLRLAEHEKEESVVMRKIKNPIPMYRYRINGAKYLPQENGDYGFDMKEGDFVAPYGKGAVADFYVRKNYDEKKRSTKSALIFKGKGNGAYKIKAFTDSEFRSCYVADTNAVFTTCFRYEYKNHKYENPKDGSHRTEVCDVNEDECLILRTRCQFDEKGNLVSCHYSRIYGKIEIFRWLNFMSCAFNPMPNDPNLEFDVKRNLNRKDTAPYLP